jgi:cell cycle checkpoint protein
MFSVGPLTSRASHKLAKPQFFGALHSEKSNAGYLDVAAAYLGSKAVKASSRVSGVALGDESEKAWGGLPSKRTLATELVPMLTKMQGMTHGKRSWLLKLICDAHDLQNLYCQRQFDP